MNNINIILLINQPIMQKLMTNYLERANIHIMAALDSIGAIGETLKQGITPDIILVCANPSDSCTSHAVAINELKPGLKYIIISNIPDGDFFLEGLSVGIRGWVDPEADISRLLATIEIVADGGISIGFSQSADIIQELIKTRPKNTYRAHMQRVYDFNRNNMADIARIDLTSREIEVLTLIAEGITNKKISETLFISENTVKTHVRNILGKLQFQSRTQVALYAVEHGILDNK
jgi:DNA-binding NarL/FixJ family response regulator